MRRTRRGSGPSWDATTPPFGDRPFKVACELSDGRSVGNAILSATALAELADAADSREEDSSAPLVLVADPISEAPAPQRWSAAAGSLSAWDPGNRANPICEVTPPKRRRAIVGAVVAAIAALVGVVTVLLH